MTLPFRGPAAALLLALAACATTPPGLPLKLTDTGPAPADPALRDRAIGEISVHVSGRANQSVYGPWRVASRGLDITRGDDGKWRGSVLSNPVALDVVDGRITGSTFNLYLFVDEATRTITIRGNVARREVRLVLTPDAINGRVDMNAPGFELRREGPDRWSGTWGPGRSIYVEMKGDAAQYPAVASPQFYLALLGVFL